MKQRTQCSILLLLFLPLFLRTTSGQELPNDQKIGSSAEPADPKAQDSQSVDDTSSVAMIAGAKEAYADIGKWIKQRKWDEVEKRMTPDGADLFCISQVFIFAELEMMEAGNGFPGIDRVRKNIKAVAKKYDLKNLIDQMHDPNMEEKAIEKAILQRSPDAIDAKNSQTG